MLARSHSEYVEEGTLLDMIREDLVAERIAIESYSEIIRYLAHNDATSRCMMKGILANEEVHAEDIKSSLKTIGKEETQSITDELERAQEASRGPLSEQTPDIVRIAAARHLRHDVSFPGFRQRVSPEIAVLEECEYGKTSKPAPQS
jgi:hypothetical protein